MPSRPDGENSVCVRFITDGVLVINLTTRHQNVSNNTIRKETPMIFK